MHYLPLALPFFTILVAIFIALVALIEIGILRYAYLRLGIGPRAAMFLLLASLVGSYFNIPIYELPEQHVIIGHEFTFYGMRYAVPVAVNWPGTIIAVNVGGALIPGVMSLYLLTRYALWIPGFVATALVATVCHALAHPVAGLGIALPVFVPSVATAVVALFLSRRHAAPLAYISGSLGTLIGADLLNLGAVRGLGAPMASIGGAGTFDGIFLVGVVSVLFAGLSGGPRQA